MKNKPLAERPLLQRLYETPHLAQVVPRLHPELLHRVIGRAGLEDCGELVALTTPQQLARLFDLDLWRNRRPGLDETFDADRFGVWLEVLVETDVTMAAGKVAGMDAGLVTAGISHHARVYDRGAIAGYTALDGTEVPAVLVFDDQLTADIGAFLVVARRSESWEAIVAVLTALESDHHDSFERVMRACRALSHTGFDLDDDVNVLADRDQAMFDLAAARERRRERHGFVAPAEARAFLEMSRELNLGHAQPPPPNAVAQSYFRELEMIANASPAAPGLLLDGEAPAPQDDEAVAAVVGVLVDAGVVANAPRALLQRAPDEAARLACLRDRMQLALDLAPAAYAARTAELTFLANAIAAGCSIMERAFTAQEASDAAASICNLGLESWPRHWLEPDAPILPDDFLVEHDLIAAFQVGWTVLHDEVCMEAAGRLVEVLRALRRFDPAIQSSLDTLRADMTKAWRAGTPWGARGSMEILSSLDLPAWAALLSLIDECPSIHDALDVLRNRAARPISPTAFQFIAERRQIDAIRQFLERLHEILEG